MVTATVPTAPPAPSTARLLGAALLTGLLLVAAGLLFAALYVVLPAQHHYGALLAIGVLSLFFALGAYLAESLSRNPAAQRALAWGFFGMGFAVLLVTVALGPMYGALTVLGQLLGLLITVLALVIAIAFIAWRARTVEATARRLAMRAAWQSSQPASALDYPAATGPSVPQVPPSPPASDPAPPRSP